MTAAIRMVRCSLFVLMSICLCAGCGGDTKTYGKVSGRVTSADKPVAEAIVLFEDPAQHLFIQATTDADGRYNFDRYPGEGLPVGSYQIAVQPPIQEIETGKPIPPPKPFPKVDPKFLDPEKSGLKLEVKAGENPFDIALTL